MIKYLNLISGYLDTDRQLEFAPILFGFIIFPYVKSMQNIKNR